MKIQYLTVIFILIIMPLVIVFSEYIDNQIETIQTEYEYDTRLFNATYDAIKAYQLNTVNNSFSDRPEDKVSEIEAAVSTFYNSLIMSFGYSGNVSSIMDDYVPAVIICLYDGYYIYSPYENVLTNLDTSTIEVDEDYKNNASLDGVHPYIYYNCHYSSSTYDLTITYTLDNFITIDGYVGTKYVYKSGYLIDLGDYGSKDIDENTTSFTYCGVTFSSNGVELEEYLGTDKYSYTKIDGTKFYLDVSAEEIFYINESGERKKQVSKSDDATTYTLYYNAIKANIDDFIYYRDAYIFTDWVMSNLSGLDASNGQISGENVEFSSTTIFSSYSNIQDSDSNFNEHRQQVIRAVIETNLSVAISAYGDKYADGSTYIMPNISETDWELIENNVCIATFMQGLNIGGKVYNGYAVVANNLTKEYVDENDIYILTTDTSSGTDAYYYTRANDNNLVSSSSSITIENITNSSETIKTAGVLKIDLERRSYYTDSGTIYYFPYSTSKYSPYLGSYSGAVTGSSLNSILTIDMYRYMELLTTTTYPNLDSAKCSNLKIAYYSRFRERENTNLQCTKWTL